MARVATQEAALAPSSNGSTTSNPAASAPPSLSAAINHSVTVQPTTPGHASQPTQAEQDEQQDLETQETLWLPAFDESWADNPAFQHAYSDEGESEIDADDPTQLEDHYPLESEAGEVDIGEYEQELEDEGAFEAEQPEQSFSGLQEQKDADVEVNVVPERPFPSSLVNVS